MDYSDVSLSKATIRTDKLLNNISTFKQLLQKDTKFMAVIKANAYSHGMIPIAKVIEEQHAANYFGVAQLSEALTLRSAGIKTPLLIFNAACPKDIKKAIQKEITLTVFSVDMANTIAEIANGMQKIAKVHLKIDTGMGRLGVSTFKEALAIYEALKQPYIYIEGIYTHFADSDDETGTDFTQKQYTHFKDILDHFKENGITFDLRHCCNTAGTINFPAYHLDMVRVGIGLYGLNPLAYDRDKIELAPVKTISSTVTYVKDFPADHSVGYNRTYYSKQPMRVATVAIGYADGVSLALSNQGYFAYKGHKLPVIGKVCMDQTMLDCTEVPELAIGEEVTYFGDPENGDVSLYELSELVGESQYDLVCRLGTRVNCVYKNEAEEE